LSKGGAFHGYEHASLTLFGPKLAIGLRLLDFARPQQWDRHLIGKGSYRKLAGDGETRIAGRAVLYDVYS